MREPEVVPYSKVTVEVSPFEIADPGRTAEVDSNTVIGSVVPAGDFADVLKATIFPKANFFLFESYARVWK